MTGENGEGAINLFGQHHAGEFVRHGERGERDFLLRAGAQFVGKTLGVAAEENQFARAAVAQVAEPARELLRSELFSGGIEQDDRGGRVDFQFAQRGGTGVAQFADFDFGVVLDARGRSRRSARELLRGGFCRA